MKYCICNCIDCVYEEQMKDSLKLNTSSREFIPKPCNECRRCPISIKTPDKYIHKSIGKYLEREIK